MGKRSVSRGTNGSKRDTTDWFKEEFNKMVQNGSKRDSTKWLKEKFIWASSIGGAAVLGCLL